MIEPEANSPEPAPTEVVDLDDDTPPDLAADPMDYLPPANQIPERFRGVWDYVEGSCARESDLRIEVGAGAIQFYEAIGTSRAVTIDRAATFVTLEMEGEGEHWQAEYLLSLSEDGELLTAHFTSNAIPNEPLTRKRCPQ